MNEATIAFLRAAYKEYYFKQSDSIEFPSDIESREFGYILFGGNMIRHKAFRKPGEVVAEILKQKPSSVYCSNARYDRPASPMEEKGWKGAELIFDIDATDIPTPCKRDHGLWYCENCHWSGRLPKPGKCTKCGGVTAEFHGTCGICLGASKEHALRVIDFLEADFGVQASDIKTYFSGNRGYHLHVFDHRFELLEQQGRGEIAEYMRGSALPASQSIASSLRRRPINDARQAMGWTRRVVSFVEPRRSTHAGTLQKLVSEAVSAQRAMVDASVTTDIHRVFRLAGTLHGTSGMCKKAVGSLEAFDPDTDPVVLSSDRVKTNVSFYPKFAIGGSTFGPFKSEVATLPTFAAVQILTRGFGEVA